MREQSRTAARLASAQKGLTTRRQLIEAEWSPAMIGRWAAKGLLIPEYRGVYRFGHAAPSTEATYLAAVLAAGDGAVLARRAAAHLMRLLRGAPPPPEVITRKERRIKGLKVKRSRRLDPRDTTLWQGIPTTTVARTLVDLAGCLSDYELGRAWHQARVLYRTEPGDVEAALARKPRAKGAKTLREVLHGKQISLSRLEAAFVELCRAHRFAVPQTNQSAGGRYVDCRWPAHKLTVELDSYRYHSSRRAWELDRKREREARPRRRLPPLHVR